MPTYLFPRILFLPGHIGGGEAEKAMQRCSAWGFWSANAEVDGIAQKLCVCLCIMHEMKCVAMHMCVGEIESSGPQLVGCDPEMGRGSFLMGSRTVGKNTMLNAIIKRN